MMIYKEEGSQIGSRPRPSTIFNKMYHIIQNSVSWIYKEYLTTSMARMSRLFFTALVTAGYTGRAGQYQTGYWISG